jgi:hypothetical protein
MAEPRSPEQDKAKSENRAEQKQEWQVRVAALPGDEAKLGEYFGVCQTALDNERDRQQSVDARLTTTIGLSSIAGIIIFGTVLNNIPFEPLVLSWLMSSALGYLVLQLISAMYAGVRGLERRAYDRMSFTDFLPESKESKIRYRRRLIEQAFDVLVQNQDQNNEKVTQMAVAHCAFKNFIGGLVVFAILAGVHHAFDAPSDELVGRLKKDAVLRELVRGPEGPQGPAGPAGQPEPAGPQGQQGPPGAIPVVPPPPGPKHPSR